VNEKTQHEQISKLLRRLTPHEQDQIGSLISKKLRNRDADEFGGTLICVDLDYITKPCEYRGPGFLDAEPEIVHIEEALMMRLKGKQIVFVSPRFKYEGGEETVKKWLLRQNIPETAVEEFFYSSCLVPGVPFVTQRLVLNKLTNV